MGTLALVLVTLAVYNRVSSLPFTNFDDDRYVTDNIHVRTGLHWEGIKWAFTAYTPNWHPVTWMAHMLDSQLFSLNPAGHHYMSLLFHLLNVVLLFLVLKRATGYAWRSLMVAALFALHPINVESVAWISELKTPVSMLFFLLALGAYQWYTEHPGVRRYAMVAAFFALGLMSKPQVITFPFVLLLWDYWPLRRMNTAWLRSGSPSTLEAGEGKSFFWLLAEKLPLLALSFANAVLTLKAQKALDAIASAVKCPLYLRVENAIVSYVRYMGKAVWPADLAVMYPLPTGSIKIWQVGVALLVLTLVSALVIKARQHRYLVVGWCWFLGTLVPMIGLVQVGSQAMADRYAYIPFLGLFMIVGWGVADWAHSRRLPAAALAVASLAVVVALASVTHRQIGYWSDDALLWSHALQVSPNNFIAEDGLGGALLNRGQMEEAVLHFRRANAFHPSDPISNLNIGFYEQQHKHLQPALERYQKVVQFTQDDRSKSVAFSNMGDIYRQLGDLGKAKDNFSAAVTLRPRNLRAWLGLGLVAQQVGDFQLAVRAYSAAADIQPQDVFYVLLARALQQSGRNQEAKAALDHGRRVSQDFAAAQRIADSLTTPSRQ
jgi:tetratricopeptide (TPR) repeat protein